MRLVPDDAWAVMTIWQEARSEPYMGMLAVAEVIRNRMRAKFFSDGTVVGTVLRDRQFSGWNNRDPNRIPSAQIRIDSSFVWQCAKAWDEAMARPGSQVAQGAFSYFNPAVVVPPWKVDFRLVATIGAHEFYVPKTTPAASPL